MAKILSREEIGAAQLQQLDRSGELFFA